MSTLEEVKRMSDEGRSEDEIISSLRRRGLSEREINSTITQAKIKDAVFGDDSDNENPRLPPVPSPNSLQRQQNTDNYQIEGHIGSPMRQMTQESESAEGMPSLMTAPQQNAPEEIFAPEPQQEYNQQEGQNIYYPTQQTDYSSQPQSYSQSYSADTITEVSEQVISEKLSPIMKELEKTIGMKNTFESRISYLDERLKRIESIIDKLQMSILNKVGQYVTSVGDIKNELIETQKSFKVLSGNKHHNPQTHPIHHHGHHQSHSEHKTKK